MKRIEDGLQCLNLAKELILADKNIPGPKKSNQFLIFYEFCHRVNSLIGLFYRRNDRRAYQRILL